MKEIESDPREREREANSHGRRCYHRAVKGRRTVRSWFRSILQLLLLWWLFVLRASEQWRR